MSYAECQGYNNGTGTGWKPLQEAMVKELLKNTVIKDHKDISNGFIGRRIVYMNWKPLDKRVMFVIPSGKREININGTSHLYNYPDLLFFVNSEELQVFALDTENVTENSILYHAPFPNIYRDSRVCLGRHSIDNSKTVNELIFDTEHWFFASAFNDWHCNAYKPKQINEHEEKKWSKEELVQTSKVGDKIKSFIRENTHG